MITARAEYACIAMLELAARYGSKKPVRLADVVKEHQIPQGFLVQIMLQMKAAGLVTTTRGTSGGYLLTKAPSGITLADIFDALDRDGEQTHSADPNSAIVQNLQGVWKKLADMRVKHLQGIKLTDLVPEPGSGSDYII